MNAKNLVRAMQKKLGSKIKEVRIDNAVHKAKKKYTIPSVWLTIEKEGLRPFVRELCILHPAPHFVVISGYQVGSSIELIYHFSLNYAKQFSELAVNVKIVLSSEKPAIPTITDFILGALVSERETQEMLGVKVEGIPDGRRLFLPKNFPKKKFPWRRDKTGVGNMVRDLHRVKK